MKRTSLALLFTALTAAAACGSSITNADDGAGGEGAGGEVTSTSSVGDVGGGGGGTPACQTPAGMGSFEIGTGEHCFESLSAGQSVPLMQGPQGGYHVWLALGCTDCGPSVQIEYGVKDPLTGEPIPETYDSSSIADLKGANWPQKAGFIVYMPGLSWDPQMFPPLAPGTPFILWVNAVQGSTVLHHAEVEVMVGDILSWNPCDETPEAPECGFDSN